MSQLKLNLKSFLFRIFLREYDKNQSMNTIQPAPNMNTTMAQIQLGKDSEYKQYIKVARKAWCRVEVL